MITKLTTSQFIERSKQVHGDRYNYSLVEYKNNCTPVKIICPIHGIFVQEANSHLKGSGCSKCATESRAKLLAAKAKSEFVSRSQEIHNNKYSYELVNYVNATTKVKITCPVHGEYEQRPNDHLAGHGCAKCGYEASGYTKSKFKSKCIQNNNGLGILYILECFNEQERFFKIGITSRSIKARYNSKRDLPYAYRVIDEIIGDPEFIYDLEIKLHKEHKQYQYIPLIPFGGHLTECFNTYMGVNQ